jgi:UDP-2,3-diacylglucosamine pyrophosphatase LpxH
MSEKKETFKRLNDHRNRAHLLPFDIKKDKFAIFGDLHKWNRSDADFFENNEDIYCSVLDYYLEKGFTLVLNGDIEELAGSPPETVLENYKKTFEKEKTFVEKGDCYRIYGNHDHDWKEIENRKKYLKPEYGTIPLVFPAVMLGEKIIILHGHEGDLFADEIHGFTKLILRLFRKLFIIITGKSPSAAKNHKIRKKREKYLFEWAKENRLLIIAGHTHRPVFETSSVSLKLRQRKEDLDRKLKETTNEAGIASFKEEIKGTETVIEELNEDFAKDKEITKEDEPTPPNYFNIGCGMFKESITAIEIDQGVISLIRWYQSDGQIKRDWTYLKKKLAEILNEI